MVYTAIILNICDILCYHYIFSSFEQTEYTVLIWNTYKQIIIDTAAIGISKIGKYYSNREEASILHPSWAPLK